MEKGYINLDEHEINDITSHLDRNKIHLGDLGSNSQNKFQSLTNTNLFGNGAKKITHQISSISQSISKMNQAIKMQTTEMLQLDNKLSEEADSIKVPMDFVRNNSVRAHIFDGITLNKNDGKSVSDDNNLNQNELQLDPTVINKNLKDITKEERNFENIKLKNYKDKNTVLENINNNQTVVNQEIRFDQNGITNQYLKSDITNSNTTNIPEINTNSAINKNFDPLNLNEIQIVDEYYYDDFFERDNY